MLPPFIFKSIQLPRTPEIGPLALTDRRPDLPRCLPLQVQLARQPRFVYAYAAARGVQAPETIEQTAMALPLAIAVTGLLGKNVRGFLRDGIRFSDIGNSELSRIERVRKRHGIFGSLEVDGDLVQIGPN